MNKKYMMRSKISKHKQGIKVYQEIVEIKQNPMNLLLTVMNLFQKVFFPSITLEMRSESQFESWIIFHI